MKKLLCYEETLLKKLGYLDIVKKYNLADKSVNEAIFYAVNSIDKHLNSCFKKNVDVENILLGDYYSFEYYSILKEDLEKLAILTKTTEKIYAILINKKYNIENILYIILAFPNLLLSYYNKQLDISDKIKLVESYYYFYKKQNLTFLSEEIFNMLMLELRKKS